MYIIPALALMVSSCCPFAIDLEDTGVEHIPLVNNVFYYHRKYAEKHHALTQLLHGGQYFGNIQWLNLHYHSEQPMNIFDARLVMLDLTEHLLEMVNNNPIVASHVQNGPLTADRVEMSISFKPEANMPNNVTFVSLSKGKIFYMTTDAKVTMSETYGEALKMLTDLAHQVGKDAVCGSF